MSRAVESRRPIAVIVQHPKAAASVVLISDDPRVNSDIKHVTRWIEDEKRKWPATRYTPAFLNIGDRS